MGTWDATNFGNDAACDWSYELENSSDLSLIEKTISAVLNSAYPEASEAEEALAAIEVMARLLGSRGIENSYTETVDKWVTRVKLKPSPELVGKAMKAIDRILSDQSELMELWQESDEFAGWKRNTEELKKRLSV